MFRSAALIVLGSLALGACQNGPKAPTTPRVCYAMAQMPDKSIRFNVVARNVASADYCSVELERMRLAFLRLGGSNREITGSYQGQFIFLREQGVFYARTYSDVRYLALRRYNGKLVMPGAVPE